MRRFCREGDVYSSNHVSVGIVRNYEHTHTPTQKFNDLDGTWSCQLLEWLVVCRVARQTCDFITRILNNFFPFAYRDDILSPNSIKLITIIKNYWLKKCYSEPLEHANNCDCSTQMISIVHVCIIYR